MLKDLYKSLISKNLMSSKVEIDADVSVSIFGSGDKIIENQHFAIIKSIIKDDDINFYSMSTINGSKITIPWTSITAIDGMTPERYAAVFDIGPDGNKLIAKHKKRGPKSN